MNELHKLRNSGITVILQKYLPPATMIVSQDVWDALKKAGKTKETGERPEDRAKTGQSPA